VKKLLFVNLMAFRSTGGLEKFNRCFLKALNGLSNTLSYQPAGISLCDVSADERYFPKPAYKGFNNNKVLFALYSIFQSLRSDVLILGHINTAIVGLVFKMLFPRKKLLLICHGIEVWQPLTGIKKKVLVKADKVLAVSEYTRQQIIKLQGKSPQDVAVFHNTIDPYFEVPHSFSKDEQLAARYGITHSDFVVYTLCRLSSKEKYKGYDAVIQAIALLADKYTNLKYLIAGKYDEAERERVDALIATNNLEDRVLFAGYIQDDEIVKHYQLGDVFIMPSSGEGFGIVFIEAMACGRQVVSGNADGSVDALRNGELGTIVDANNIQAIAKAIEEKMQNVNKFDSAASVALQQSVIRYFGFDAYKNNLKNLLQPILN